MEQYIKSKNLTDRKLQAFEEDILKFRTKSQELIERHSMLIQRQNDFTQVDEAMSATGSDSASSNSISSDMLKLNVGGMKMHILRETLTLIKGSRLAILFSGTNGTRSKWESKFLTR
jgi:hypothetical protein